MKKIVLILLSALLMSACSEPGVMNPGAQNEEVYIQIGSKTYQVHYVILTERGHGIYILAPKDTAVKVSIDNIGFTSGKSPTSVIKVE